MLALGTNRAPATVMAIAPFPHHYEVALELDQLTAPPRSPIHGGAPPQFGGADTVWSPEELLLAAVLLCVKTTFDAYASRQSLPILAWSGRVDGTLDKAPHGPELTSVHVELTIATTTGNEMRVHDLVRTVERSCIISRALEPTVTISADVTVAD
jgi:organic hydroperoxide reductase OsmC/OhrA